MHKTLRSVSHFGWCELREVSGIHLVNDAASGNWLAVTHPYWDWNEVLQMNNELDEFGLEFDSLKRIDTFDLTSDDLVVVTRGKQIDDSQHSKCATEGIAGYWNVAVTLSLRRIILRAFCSHIRLLFLRIKIHHATEVSASSHEKTKGRAAMRSRIEQRPSWQPTPSFWIHAKPFPLVKFRTGY